MERRVQPDYYRNTSEELFIKVMMESPSGMPAPTMEMLGFRNLSQTFRTDSEELFKSWLKHGENNGCSPTGVVTRPRQASRRISTEPSNLSNQQTDGSLQERTEDIPLEPSTSSAAAASANVNQHSVKDVAESGWQASNLFLAKAWFHSSQPMTRSRSSELRRRYAAMQNLQTSIGVEATLMHNAPEDGVNVVNSAKQDYANQNGFSDVPKSEEVNQFYASFTSPTHSSSSTFNTPLVDNISSVVSMLKGTLERKKLSNKDNKEAIDESGLGYYGAEFLANNTNLNEGQDHMYHETQGGFQDAFTLQVSDADVLKAVEESLNVNLDGILAPTYPIQMSMASQEPSQSESSAAAPVVSAAYDTFDDSNSGQALIVCENSRKRSGHCAKPKDIRERSNDNLKDEAKKAGLVRHGSLTPAGSASLLTRVSAVDEGDPTKKRRVERSRKMAEAKERNSSPAIPSDMQSLLKRCENLEKEVRSLKLNLAFMNRKDSEQTKQIEELQKENKELADEKERLLEEIERIIADSGKV